MSKRRTRGATLSLVAVTLLVVVILGVAFYFLMKILGGGREVANATDAGTLNIAREAMINPMIPSEGDFVLLGLGNNPGKMSLLNYNRAVAQTLLVALNAQDEGTPEALGHAQAVLGMLNSIGNYINTQFQDSSYMGPNFDNLSGVNSTKMFGGSAASFQSSTYRTAAMKIGQSTNVYFDMASFPTNGQPPANLQVSGNTITPGVAGMGNYMAGYTGFTVPGVGTIYGVPVMPGQNPHLVSLKDFNNATQTFPNTPANAFSAGSTALDQKTGVFGGAVACSIVGCTKGQPEVNEAAGDIPGGYLEIVNLPGTSLPAGFSPTDNSANLFNNQLYYEPGLLTADAGPDEVFAAGNASTNDVAPVSNLQAWIDWANAGGSGTQPNSTDGIYISKSPGSAGVPLSNPPTSQDLATLKSLSNCTNCLNQLNTQGVPSGNCAKWLNTYAATYNPLPVNSGTWPGGSQYSAVDLAKADLLNAFQNTDFTYTPPSTSGATGLGVYPPDPTGQNRPIGSYGLAWPAVQGPLQQTGTILQLLKQVDGQPASTVPLATAEAQLLQRCKEIKPGCTEAEMETLLANTPLPMGLTVYLYRSNAGTGPLVITTYRPITKSTATPDGSTTTPLATASNTYNASGTLVDTDSLSTGGMGGDDNLHRAPYMNSYEIAVATDHANFISSSGYGNLLGQLQFSNTIVYEEVSSPSGPNNNAPSNTGGQGGQGSSNVLN